MDEKVQIKENIKEEIKEEIKEKRKIKIIVLEKFDINWSITEIAEKRTPRGWVNVFKDSIASFQLIDKLIKDERYYPLKEDIFRAFELTPLNKVDVVIIGQDPYPNLSRIKNVYIPQAMGLSFSVRKGDNIPSSLNNIFKELRDEYPGEFVANHGDLTSWAKQGVLLLNTSLTFNPDSKDKSTSHIDIWIGFITKVIKEIVFERPNVIFVLWGNYSQKLVKPLIGSKVRLESPHPSGFSANKGFFGNNHFIEINNHLMKIGKKPINWSLE